MRRGGVIESIYERIYRYNKNFMAIVVGETGSGKSYAALRLAELLDPEFNISRCVFTVKDFVDFLNSGNAKKGNVIVFDEIGVAVGSRNWYSQSNKLFNHIAQVFRSMNLIVLLTTPNLDFLDKQPRSLIHGLFQPVTINKSKGYNVCKAYNLQVNNLTGKIYYHKFKTYNTETQEVNPIHRLKIHLPSKELRNAYERKKDLFVQSINKKAEEGLQELPEKAIKKGELSNYETMLKDKIIKEGKMIKEIAEELQATPQMISKHLDIISAKIDLDLKGTSRIREKKKRSLIKDKVLYGYNIKGFDGPPPPLKMRKKTKRPFYDWREGEEKKWLNGEYHRKPE